MAAVPTRPVVGVVVAALLAAVASQNVSVPAPVNLTVEFLTAVDALGIDVRQPLLAWRAASDNAAFPQVRGVSQLTYSVEVDVVTGAVSSPPLTQAATTIWSSGIVSSDRSSVVVNVTLSEDSVYRCVLPLTTVRGYHHYHK